jgi:integrase
LLTKSTIDHAELRAVPYVIWDDELGGFGCKVFPSGKRSFVVRYRLRGSRKRYQPTIGTYGVLTVAAARTQARIMLTTARFGQDPQAETKSRRAQASALTVAKLVEQYIAALHAGTAATKRLRGREPAPGYISDCVLHLNRFAGVYGTEPADTVSRGDVFRLLNDYIRQPSTHRRMHGAITRMYAWARKQGLLTGNPTADIDTTSPPSRERVLSLDELARIWRAAETLEPLYSDTVKLMITTGQRRAEVSGMRWGEIDLARALWTLPAARTKARRQHVLPLPPLAVAVLLSRRMALRNAASPDDLVLPTLSRDGASIAPISGWNWLKRQLDRTAGVNAWRLHDFRRSIVTICAEHGAEIAVLDSMLNHASSATRGGVIGTYQRATLLEPMRKVMALWDRLLSDELRIETHSQMPSATEATDQIVYLAARP